MAVTIKKVLGTISYMGGIPFIPEPFLFSMMEMIQYNYEFLLKPNETIWYNKAVNSYHSTARNDIVKRMKGDWLLMLDTDHAFDPDILKRMLDLISLCDFDVPVLTGLYQFKVPPYEPNIYKEMRVKGKKEIKRVIIPWWEEKAKIFPIDGSGAGCLLVRKDVFIRIRKELKEEPFTPIPPLSEDISFFKRIKKLNIPVYAAPQIESRHLTWKEVSLKDRQVDFDRLNKIISILQKP